MRVEVVARCGRGPSALRDNRRTASSVFNIVSAAKTGSPPGAPCRIIAPMHWVAPFEKETDNAALARFTAHSELEDATNRDALKQAFASSWAIGQAL